MLSLLAFGLGGCALADIFHSKPVATPKQVSVTQAATVKEVAATNAADAAVSTERAQHVALEAKTLSNINAAITSNQANPDGPPKVEVDGELGVAAKRLAGVASDPAEDAAAAQRKLLVESGKTAEARQAYSDASNQATRLSTALTLAQKSTDDALKARDVARTELAAAQTNFAAQLKQNQLDNDTLYAAKLKSIADGEMHEQAKDLRLAGFACVLIFALGVGFGQLAGLRVVWPFILIGMMCLGLAQIISQPWFKYAELGVAIVAVIAILWWVWDHYKQGDLAQAATSKAQQFTTVANDIVPILDQAYSQVDAEGKALLDKYIFTPLNSTMDAATKATIHQVRAVQAVAPVAQASAPATS